MSILIINNKKHFNILDIDIKETIENVEDLDFSAQHHYYSKRMIGTTSIDAYITIECNNTDILFNMNNKYQEVYILRNSLNVDILSRSYLKSIEFVDENIITLTYEINSINYNMNYKNEYIEKIILMLLRKRKMERLLNKK